MEELSFTWSRNNIVLAKNVLEERSSKKQNKTTQKRKSEYQDHRN